MRKGKIMDPKHIENIEELQIIITEALIDALGDDITFPDNIAVNIFCADFLSSSVTSGYMGDPANETTMNNLIKVHIQAPQKGRIIN